MLTEKEVSLQWRDLFQGSPIDSSVFARAADLIDELPATSPLRQRYSAELSDLKRINGPPAERAPKKAKRRPAV